MNSHQLRQCLSLIKTIPVHVCASDELQNITSDQFIIICNNEPSFKPGLHWLAFFKSKHQNVVEFFDSFGLNIEMYGYDFSNFVIRYGGSYKSCELQLQSNKTSLCGQFCLYFILNRFSGISYQTILNTFSKNLKNNDNIVTNFINKTFSSINLVKCTKWECCCDTKNCKMLFQESCLLKM